MRLLLTAFFPLLLWIISCDDKPEDTQSAINTGHINNKAEPADTNTGNKTIHVLVALCDNKFQGILPVPAAIGNGQDPKNNLYWGAGYGIKSFFNTKSKEWQLIKILPNPDKKVLERLLFKNRSKNVYLLADAYDGQFIKETTIDFFQFASGNQPEKIEIQGSQLYFGGAADLVAYIGHDGLMDFSLSQVFPQKTKQKKEVIILACYSKNYFAPHLKKTGAFPLVWTTGLMAPEAYTLHDAIGAWVNDKPVEKVREAAALAYSKYQKCGIGAARRLLTTGW